jgi:hypothetical protein
MNVLLADDSITMRTVTDAPPPRATASCARLVPRNGARPSWQNWKSATRTYLSNLAGG